jgi:O-antigen/teichoic acid export membrane protein
MAATPSPQADDPIAALARGGRLSFLGFLLRLGARLPFLVIAGQLYGAASLGRFAYAVLVVELTAQLATLGLKRGLAIALAKTDRPHSHVIWDALVLGWALAAIGAAFLANFPRLVFPNSFVTGLDRAFPATALAIVGSDIALAALAFRHRIGAQVRARSIIEPWVLTIVATALAFTMFKRDALIIAYAVSMVAALVASLAPCIREFGLPHGWHPHPERLAHLARANVSLAGADAIEWATRRLDLFILGIFAAPSVMGIYYVAQQVASLPQKLKTSFDPVLGPLLSTSLVAGDRAAMAGHVRQVGFWIIAAQVCVAIALGLPGEAVLNLVGGDFGDGETVLGVLLIVEVLAATAAVSEAALVYTNPHRNLMLSIVTIGVQAAVTVALVVALRDGGPLAMALGAALGLAIALTLGSVLKSRLLARELGAPVAGLRLALLPAAAGAAVIGLLARSLPDLGQILLGIPMIIVTFGAIMWRWGFRPDDRVLFRKRSSPSAAGT